MELSDFLLKLFTSEAAIALYVTLVLFIWRKVKINYQLDSERWEGIVTQCFLAAENAGLASGNAKLSFALEEFNRVYEETYGQIPDAKDIKDAALDFARKALELKFAPKKGPPQILP